MREIRFRAKRKDNGKWTKGYLFTFWERAYIVWGTTNGSPNTIEVDPETVGQLTGLKDKTGLVEIYEGDIVEAVIYADEDPQVLEVKYRGSAFVIEYEYGDGEGDGMLLSAFPGTLRIVGTAHDNPELLAEDK